MNKRSPETGRFIVTGKAFGALVANVNDGAACVVTVMGRQYKSHRFFHAPDRRWGPVFLAAQGPPLGDLGGFKGGHQVDLGTHQDLGWAWGAQGDQGGSGAVTSGCRNTTCRQWLRC